MTRTWRLFSNTSHHCCREGASSGDKGDPSGQVVWQREWLGIVYWCGGGFCVILVLSVTNIGQILISRLFPISCSYLNL